MTRTYVEINVASNALPERWGYGWRVELIDDDGGVDIAVFYGRDAEADARAYAAWKKEAFTRPAETPPQADRHPQLERLVAGVQRGGDDR